MNLHQKIVEIRKSMKGFSKDTKAYNFQYVSGNQILRMIKEKMDELNVLLIPNVDYNTLHWEKHEYKNAKDQDKLDFIVQAKLTYKWVNAEEPSDFIEVPWLMLGQQADDVSKAVGTSLTYNERYFLLKFFGLPTDEDDADNRNVEYGGRSQQQQPNRNPNAATNRPNTPEQVITENQAKRLFAISKSKNMSTEDLKTLVNRISGKNSTKELTKSEYDKICAELGA